MFQTNSLLVSKVGGLSLTMNPVSCCALGKFRGNTRHGIPYIQGHLAGDTNINLKLDRILEETRVMQV